MKMFLPWIARLIIVGCLSPVAFAVETGKPEPAAQRGMVVAFEVSRASVDVAQARAAGKTVSASIALFNRGKEDRPFNFPYSAVQEQPHLTLGSVRPQGISSLPVASERFAFRLLDSKGLEVWRSTAAVPSQPALGRNGASLGYSLLGVTEPLKSKARWVATIALPVEVGGHLLYRDSYQVEAWLTADPRIHASSVLEVTGGDWPPIPGQNVTGNLLRIDETNDAGRPTGGYVRLQQIEGTGTLLDFHTAVWARGDGTFQLSLPPGRYRANPVDSPATTDPKERFYHPPVFNSDTEFAVVAGENLEINFKIGHPPAPFGSASGLRGIATVSPINGGPSTGVIGGVPGGLTYVETFYDAAVASALPIVVKRRSGTTEGEVVFQGLTDALGRYQVSLAAGDYRIQLGEASGFGFGARFETADVTIHANEILYRSTDFDTGIR